MKNPGRTSSHRPARAEWLGVGLALIAAGIVRLPVTTSLAHQVPSTAAGSARTTATSTATSTGMAYSTASAHAVQRQPSPGSCHARGSGIYTQPDRRCTPGALNPSVRQATIGSTICSSGWTSTVRPPESITEPEKFANMAAYGDPGGASAYEYDHLVPLELGGAVNDRRNLWPEPGYPGLGRTFYRNPKDKLERALKRLVCDGAMPLSEAQRSIATGWVRAYRRYG